MKILEKYFGAVDEDDAEVAPEIGTDGQFAFGGTADTAPHTQQVLILDNQCNDNCIMKSCFVFNFDCIFLQKSLK